MQLSIIIVSYNTRDILRDCLLSIQDARIPLTYEVIVVDNASTDGSPQMVEQEFPELVLLKNSANLMFAKANNQAMKIAKGDYLLLLNSDCVVLPGSIEKLYEFLHAHQPQVACVGPRLLNKDRTFQSEGHAFYSPMYALWTVTGLSRWPIPTFLKRRILPDGYPRFDRGRTRKVGWVAGAAMMVARTAVDAIGTLDETLYFYGEESEWCFRARTKRYEVWVHPHAEIIHLGGASTTSATLGAVDKHRSSQMPYYICGTAGLTSYFVTSLIFLLCLPVVGVLLGVLPEPHRRSLKAVAVTTPLRIIKACLAVPRRGG